MKILIISQYYYPENFIINDIIPTSGNVDYRSLMPPFPGVSEAGSCRDWDTGIPIDLDRIRDKDEEYWNKYRGTPKAFLTENTGSRLWKNKFGTRIPSCLVINVRAREKMGGI